MSAADGKAWEVNRYFLRCCVNSFSWVNLLSGKKSPGILSVSRRLDWWLRDTRKWLRRRRSPTFCCWQEEEHAMANVEVTTIVSRPTKCSNINGCHVVSLNCCVETSRALPIVSIDWDYWSQIGKLEAKFKYKKCSIFSSVRQKNINALKYRDI